MAGLRSPYHSLRQPCFVLIFLCCSISCISVLGQRLNFIHYSTEEGLAESQANDICQDSYHHLWIATLGGISRFDGKEFTNYSEKDGLLNNFVNCVYADSANRIWAGTPFGLSCFNGRHFNNFVFSKNPAENGVSQVIEDGLGTIWVLVNLKLFKFEQNQFKAQALGEDSAGYVSAIATDPNGMLWAAVLKKGLYRFHDNSWELIVDFKALRLNNHFNKIFIEGKTAFKCWLEYGRGLFLVDRTRIIDSIRHPEAGNNFRCLSINEDKSSNLWLGTNKGAYRYANRAFELYTTQNGFTDNTVNVIFKDNENNLWFGTNGDGIFRYSFDPFLFIDRSQGLKSPEITCLAKDRNRRIWLGSYGDGLYQYDPSKKINQRITHQELDAQHINSLFSDRDGQIWMGTDNEGIWKYQQDQFVRIDNSTNKIPPTSTCITQDAAGAIWISTPVGCLRLLGNQVYRYLENTFISTVYCYSKDSVFIGTLFGLYMWTGDSGIRRMSLPRVDSSNLLCMERRGEHLLIGTGQHGILDWNISRHEIKSLSSTDGLNNDAIFSMAFDSSGMLWVGTGHGIDRVNFDNSREKPLVSNYSEYGTLSAAECNQEAVMIDGRDIWFGTTQGAIILNNSLSQNTPVPTHIVLQSVLLFGKAMNNAEYNDSVSSWYNIPAGLRLPYNQNNLTFRFRGIGFYYGGQVFYQYKMEGFDKTYSELTASPEIVYPSLLPGKYRLLVRSYTKLGSFSENTIAFPFEITEAFYNSNIFRVFIVILVIGLALGVQGYRNQKMEKRKWKMEQIKKEEQINLKQRTSEDFHDELGNRLTRISVLSNILQTQALPEDSVKIIDQMKENIAGLYIGTRDILWALQPGNDLLDEIIKRLADFGMELFQDTSVLFHYKISIGLIKNTHVQGDISRNISMIFKEAMNNSLKYAKAANVFFEASSDEHGILSIQLQDDGRGFNLEGMTPGLGINNMYQRASRIGAIFSLESQEEKGTDVRLSIKITPNKG
jgi:ligand-binding sensor domain-containing protein/signal transduction histidine kinase